MMMLLPPEEFPWSRNAGKLKTWFVVYLLTLSAGLTLAINSNFENPIGWVITLGSLIPYITSLVFAYRVQDALNRAKLYKSGAWQIIAGGLLLNPYILGFLIPASVLWVTRRIERRIRQGKVEYPAVAVL
ncbi:MAG TPA: hypothetical protein VNJ06_13875 [Gemmatimonadales bacterium]|nr:hypothetical protein [Gemmatimonadales bacterium]